MHHVDYITYTMYVYYIYILSILSISISIYLYVYIYVYTISIAISISISMICIIIIIYSTWVHVWVMYIVYIILRASPCFSFSLRFPAPHQVPDPHGDPWRDPDGIEPTPEMLGWMGYIYIYVYDGIWSIYISIHIYIYTIHIDGSIIIFHLYKII